MFVIAMKYCHECGTKLEKIEENTPIIKTKEGMNHKKSKLLNAAGALVIIAAILCSLIAVVGICLCFEQGPSGYYYETYYNYHPDYHPEKLITGIFGLFGLIFGIISGVLIYARKMLSLVLVGQGALFTAATFSAILGIGTFIGLGLPILIMGTISTVFTCISTAKFSS